MIVHLTNINNSEYFFVMRFLNAKKKSINFETQIFFKYLN